MKLSLKGEEAFLVWASEILAAPCNGLYHLSCLTPLRYGEIFDWHPTRLCHWWPQATWDVNFDSFYVRVREVLMEKCQRAT